MRDCKDCLHTPSGKCQAHRENKPDPFWEPGLVTQEPSPVKEYKKRLFGPNDTLEDIIRRNPV